LHYQVVVLDSEIGNAMTIQSLKWKRSPFGDDHGSFNDLRIYMGYTTLDALGTTFASNYVAGSRTLVFSGDPYTITGWGSDTWYTTNLDTDFFYNGSNNLLIEMEWSTGSNSIYIYHWDASMGRSVNSSTYGASSGTLDSLVPHLILTGNVDLESETFAFIKYLFS
jgi:hypothetical protein